MDFFDKLGKKASQTYKYTTEKTSKIAKEAKLKIAMNENKSKIEELYEEIGKVIYRYHLTSRSESNENIDNTIQDFCVEIDEICDRIEEQRKEILNLKDKKQCVNCFYEIELECNYCPNCGIEQEKEDIYKENDIQEENIDIVQVEEKDNIEDIEKIEE